MQSPYVVGLKQNHLGQFYYDVDGAPIIVEHPVQVRFVGKFFPRPGEERARLEKFDPKLGRWITLQV